MSLGMTDGDVVRRAVDLAPGSSSIMERERNAPFEVGRGYKNIFRVVWSGKPAIDLMWRILPYMGERRSAKILDVIADWNELRFADCRHCATSFVRPTSTTKFCSVDCREANRKSVRPSRAVPGAKQPLSEEQVELILSTPNTYGSGKKLAEELGIHPVTVSRIRKQAV